MKPLRHTLHLNAIPYTDWLREQHNETSLIFLPDTVNASNQTLMLGTVLNQIDTDIPDAADLLPPGTKILFEATVAAPIQGQQMLEPGEYVSRYGGPWGERAVLAIIE